MSQIVVGRYARALFELTEEAGVSAAVQNDFVGLDNLHTNSEEFRNFISNPVISSMEKQNLLDVLFVSKMHKQTLSFLHFLADKKRLAWMPQISAAFAALYLSSQELLPATIESKVALSKTQLDRITDRFQKIYGKKLVPELLVRKEMLGGFRVQIQNMIFDHTIESKLRKFKQAIINH